MKKKNQELLVGASIFIALFILIAGVMWLKEVSVTHKLVEYTVVFPNVGVLQPGDPVTVNGIKRGTIARMYLHKSKVAAVISLDRSVTLTDSCTITVQNIGLMGERMIGIQLSENGTPYKPSQKGRETYIDGEFDSGIAEAMGMLGRVLTDVQDLISAVQRIVDETVGDTGFVDFFNNLVARLDTVTYLVEALVVENKPGLQRAITNLQLVTDDVKSLLDENTGNVENILANGSELTEQALAITANVDSIAASIKSMLADIERGEGTIGMLVEDEEFSKNIRKSIEDLDTLIGEIQEDGLKLRVKLGFRKDRKSRSR
ncbi:MAG: MCE family protein [Chitinivibrionales bacterium]|nr:MCE family protein [Chitinivibrionales bacterium]MBD3395904.1 MCE family protein [Chitinivibrionales bacterium]